MSRALVVIDHGPSTERGWLALRTALALSLGGHDVAVFLYAEGAGWALPVDARAWLGGDPDKEVAGLLDDASAAVIVDRGSLEAIAGASVEPVRGIVLAERDDFDRRYSESATVVSP
jgi:hypothetical protein